MENSCIHCNRGFRSSYIRKSIPLLCLLLVSSVLSAQTLTLESSQPAHMSEGVDLNTTVSFTFSEALDVNTIVSEDLGDYILVRPENAITIDTAYYSDDHRTIFLDVVHHQETDYVWTFTGLPNPENVMMDRFRVVNYTTSSAVSDITIGGGLAFEERPLMFEKSIPEESLSKNLFQDSPAMNTQGTIDNPGRTFSPRLSSPYSDHQMESMEKLISSTLEASGDEDISWGHTMIWVLENLDFMYNEESDGPGDELVNIGVADPATGNYLVENVRAGDYYVLALLTQPSSDFDVVGFGFLEDDDGLPLMLTVDDAGVTDVDITIYGFTGEPEPIDASEAFALAEDAMADYPDARPVEMWGNDSALEDFNDYQEGTPAPSGKSYFWEVIYLDDVDSLVYFTMAAGSSAWMVESFHLSEIPDEERPPVSFEDIMTIPDPFISSQTALNIAGENGVDSLLALLDSDWVDIEYMLSSFYFEYPNMLNADSPFFWSVMLESYGWDNETQTARITEAHFLIDAETGDFLGKMIDTYSDSEDLVDFEDVFPGVETVMAPENENAWFVYSWGQEEFHLPNHPTGSSHEWMLVWLDPDTEMIDIFHTRGLEVEEHENFPISDIPEEERDPVDLIKPVTGVTIGSSEALDVAMENGLIITLNEVSEEAETWIDYTLSRYYFSHPDFLDENSNPFWEIELTAEEYNGLWELTDSLKVVHLVDAVTGDHLASKTITTTEPTADLPSRIALHQNYPNPFNPVTNIGWELDAERHVSLIVFDLLGRKVATLADQSYPAGVHIIPFDASRLASGVYIYQLDTDGVILNRKMTVVK